MSQNLQPNLQQMPRSLAIFAAMIALNTLLVGWSVLQKHLWASPQSETNSSAASSKLSGDELTGDELTSDELIGTRPAESNGENAPPLTAQEQLKQLLPPEIAPDTAAIAPDDPLFDEIRKQAANHFPELNSGWDFSSSSDQAEAAPQDWHALNLGPSSTEMAVIQTKLETLGQLNWAALRLVHLAGQQRQLGHEEQARRSMRQCQQVRTLMLDLLQN
jgi:hypothetical protein